MRSLLLLLRAIKVLQNWTVELRDMLGVFPRKTLLMKLRNGWVFEGRMDSIDRCSFNEVWLERVYDPPGIPWETYNTIVDIGGHIGAASLYFAAKAPGAQIICCEPSPENFAILQKNIERNNLQGRVHAEQIAVADTSGTREFHLTSSTGGNSLYKYEQGGTTITVQTKSLADLFTEHHIERCDFLKIDCEGAEYDILYATKPETFRAITCIILEYHHFTSHPQGNPEALAAFLREQGYETSIPSKSILLAKRA
jgi:FkbM family methyltransferase